MEDFFEIVANGVGVFTWNQISAVYSSTRQDSFQYAPWAYKDEKGKFNPPITTLQCSFEKKCSTETKCTGMLL